MESKSWKDADAKPFGVVMLATQVGITKLYAAGTMLRWCQAYLILLMESVAVTTVCCPSEMQRQYTSSKSAHTIKVTVWYSTAPAKTIPPDCAYLKTQSIYSGRDQAVTTLKIRVPNQIGIEPMLFGHFGAGPDQTDKRFGVFQFSPCFFC